MMSCPSCNRDATLETGRTIYPHRSDLSTHQFWACLDCRAWVGCFRGTTNAMGRIANAETRRLKVNAHTAFDPIWKTGYMTRTEAYGWLRKVTGLSAKECHMGWMSDKMLKGVEHVCKQFCIDKGIT